MPAQKPRPNLNSDDIVEATLALVRENGVSGFSMRQLSERLGASVGATYRHLPTKEALLELCGESLFDRSWRPISEGEDPLEWLSSQVMNLYNVLREHRGIATYVVQHSRSASRNVSEPVHQVLLQAGFSEDDAVLAGTVLTLYTAGALLVDFERAVALDTDDPKGLVEAGIRFILSNSRIGATRAPAAARTKRGLRAEAKTRKTAAARA